MLGDMAHQDPIDIGIEVDLRTREREILELVLRARRADVRPALEHVRFLECCVGMALADRDTSRPRPFEETPIGESGGQAQVVLLGRLLAEASTPALAHLAREARATTFLPPELAPAQPLRARDLLEHRLHVRLGGERAIEHLRAGPA